MRAAAGCTLCLRFLLRHGREPERCPPAAEVLEIQHAGLGMTIGQSDGKKVQDLIRCDCIGECRSSRAVHRGSGDARFGSFASVWRCPSHFRFSNRPFGVKHFQAIHHCNVDVSHGLALLFGIGTKALPSWDPRTRRNNLYRGLAVSMTAGPSGSTNSPHPSSREGHLSTAR
jgi:hypothetical protein